MADRVQITHKFKSQKADSQDASLIRPSSWNEEHKIVLPGLTFIGNISTDEGEAVPIKLGAGISIVGDTLVSGYPGAIVFSPTLVPPPGTVKANGALLSRATYHRLFAAIGTTFGAGDGATTFAVPDYRAEFLRGLDDGRGIDVARTLIAVQLSQNLAHAHTGSTAPAGKHGHNGSTNWTGQHSHDYELSRPNDSGGGGWYNSFGGGQNMNVNRQYGKIGESGGHSHTVNIDQNGEHTHAVSVAEEGGTEARPRNRAVLICIQF